MWVALIAIVPLTITAVAALLSSSASRKTLRETRPNGGSSMRDEITRIGVEVRSAHVYAEQASASAARAEVTAQSGSALAREFHADLQDRVVHLAEGLAGNRHQIADLRKLFGLEPVVADRRRADVRRPVAPGDV